MGVEEIVLPMGPISQLKTSDDIDVAVTNLSRGV
jgi:hypothetical protein